MGLVLSMVLKTCASFSLFYRLLRFIDFIIPKILGAFSEVIIFNVGWLVLLKEFGLAVQIA